MRKLLLVIVVVAIGLTASAQTSSASDRGGFNAGISLGLPIGDAGDGWTFNVTLDLNHLWNVSDAFDAGIATGYAHSFGDTIDLGEFGEIDLDDASFIPVAAAARYRVSDTFTLGADLGYAIGISPDGNDGGFYYAPKVQFGVSDSIDIVGAYRGVSVEGGSFDVITLGVEFKL
ncbi:outer membrane protein with beta-barrel domain [Flavobacteriaceae bacterium MAR_2010_72]|nr:outer membrane protein with beta-barrel domain [Flavobacteriaceae bacterium MAR_2010_72]